MLFRSFISDQDAFDRGSTAADPYRGRGRARDPLKPAQTLQQEGRRQRPTSSCGVDQRPARAHSETPSACRDLGALRLAVQLADARERDNLEDRHLARVLVRGEPAFGELDYLLRCRLAARPQRHERHDLLAEPLVSLGKELTDAITAGKGVIRVRF